ncbi:MAG: response regulator [Bacilli bacterium]|nr:response regulator [Bacilli bacterium]
MDFVSLTLNLVCMGFLIFLIILYASKKKMQNMDNMIYRYILLCTFGVLFFEIAYVLCAYFFLDNLFIVGLAKRANFYCINLFFVSLGYYVSLLAIEKNEKALNFYNARKDFIFKILLILIFVIGILEFTLPLDFVFNDNGSLYYTGGLATNPLAGGVAALLALYLFPFLIITWKLIDKRKLAPLGIVLVLELITLGVNLMLPSLCLASFSLSMTSYLMFFTIENPDLKMIAKLELAKNAAEKANNAKSDFLSSMSHEIRTPLNAIVGLSQMIKDTDDVKEIHDDTDDIMIASQNLMEIVNGILDISKLEANKMDVIEVDYNPNDIFMELNKIMKVRIGEKPIELRFNIDENIPVNLYGDREKIKQILTNLLTNAIKYTEKGFVDFNVSSSIEKGICNLTISVKDTGRGMKEEMLPNLFTKFNRLDEDKDTNIEGTGLGLAITKSLVELLDGTIGVESTYGVGSTFTVTVPQKVKEAAPETSADNIEIKIADVSSEEVKNVETPSVEKNEVPKVNEMPEEVKEKVVEEKKEIPQVNEMPEEVKEEVKEEKKEIPQVNEMPEEVKDKEPEIENKVEESQQVNNADDNSENGRLLLVVDDNKVNLKVASRMLEDFNFHIDTAHSGFEAIDKIKNHKKYDLIFMDIMMPDMNGVETMQKLKAMDGFNTPIIALTADAMDGSREKYLAVGFNEYVSKPIIKQVLQEVLGKYVDVDDINIVKNTDDLSKN